MKYVLRAWGQLKRGGVVLALCEMFLRAWGELKRGFEVLALVGEMCLQGMGAVETGVSGVGIV